MESHKELLAAIDRGWAIQLSNAPHWSQPRTTTHRYLAKNKRVYIEGGATSSTEALERMLKRINEDEEKRA